MALWWTRSGTCAVNGSKFFILFEERVYEKFCHDLLTGRSVYPRLVPIAIGIFGSTFLRQWKKGGNLSGRSPKNLPEDHREKRPQERTERKCRSIKLVFINHEWKGLSRRVSPFYFQVSKPEINKLLWSQSSLTLEIVKNKYMKRKNE